MLFSLKMVVVLSHFLIQILSLFLVLKVGNELLDCGCHRDRFMTQRGYLKCCVKNRCIYNRCRCWFSNSSFHSFRNLTKCWVVSFLSIASHIFSAICGGTLFLMTATGTGHCHHSFCISPRPTPDSFLACLGILKFYIRLYPQFRLMPLTCPLGIGFSSICQRRG